jgi:formylglycine-generating enzyme required for sulfatase activity
MRILKEVFMFNIFWGIFILTVLSVNCASAADNNSRVSDTSAKSKIFNDPTTGLELVYVKGGCYQMGSNDDDCDANRDEMPVHEVCVEDFYLGRYEVTQAQWKKVMGSNTTNISTCRDDSCPIDNVSWSDVQSFIHRLNSASGAGKFRLPTEAEWEYAARNMGKNEQFSGGKDLGKVAWYADNSGKRNHPVGTRSPNGLGLYDMSGNVWEMTIDWYAKDYYSGSPRLNPPGPASGIDHVIRGGCRTGGITNQRTTRRTYINDRTGSDRGGNVGFRLFRYP